MKAATMTLLKGTTAGMAFCARLLDLLPVSLPVLGLKRLGSNFLNVGITSFSGLPLKSMKRRNSVRAAWRCGGFRVTHRGTFLPSGMCIIVSGFSSVVLRRRVFPIAALEFGLVSFSLLFISDVIA